VASCSGLRARPSLSRLVSCVMMGVLLSRVSPASDHWGESAARRLRDEVAGRSSCSGSDEELGGFPRGAGLTDAGGASVRHLTQRDRLPGVLAAELLDVADVAAVRVDVHAALAAALEGDRDFGHLVLLSVARWCGV